jgi:hypothetical protein
MSFLQKVILAIIVLVVFGPLILAGCLIIAILKALHDAD